MPPNRSTRTRSSEHLSPSTSPRRLPRLSDTRPDSYRLSTISSLRTQALQSASSNRPATAQTSTRTTPTDRPLSIGARIAQSWSELQAYTQPRQSAPPPSTAPQRVDRLQRSTPRGPSASHGPHPQPRHPSAAHRSARTGSSSSPPAPHLYTGSQGAPVSRAAPTVFDRLDGTPLYDRLIDKVSTRQRGRPKLTAAEKAARLSLARLEADPRYEMSIFNPSSSLLQAKAEIVFGNGGTVDMLGGTNTGCNYSLPGHIIITLPSSTKRILRELREVKLVVESMAEWADASGGYTPMRIFAQTYIFASLSNPIPFPNYDRERPFDSRVRLAIPFDLRLPGWLPPSLLSMMSRIAHGCQVSMTVGWVDRASFPNSHPFAAMQAEALSRENAIFSETSTASASRSSLTSKLGFGGPSFFTASQPATAIRAAATGTVKSKYAPFLIRRHRLPRALALGPRIPSTTTSRPTVNVRTPIEVIMTLPDWVDVHGDARAIRVELRIRVNAAAFEEQLAIRAERQEQEQERLAMTSNGFANPSRTGGMPGSFESARSIDKLADETPATGEKEGTSMTDFLTYVHELGMDVVETERFRPYLAYTQAYPIPANQPDRTNTINPLINPEAGYDGTLDADFGSDGRYPRYTHTRQCLLAEDGSQRNYFFANGGLGMTTRWRKVNVVLPMPKTVNNYERRPQSELDSPFLRIRHELRLRMVCLCPGEEEKKKTVNVTVPIRFGTQPSTYPGMGSSQPTIPPYVQLFYENGEQRECDALPIYEESCKDDQPPPFSPIAPVMSQSSVRAASEPVSSPSPFHGPEEVPAPGETLTAGEGDSRSPSPSPPSEPSDEDDDPMDGSYRSDMSFPLDDAPSDIQARPDLTASLRGADGRPITTSPAATRTATATPPITRFAALACRFQGLQLPPPTESMLPDVLSAGARSPSTPRAYPYPSFAAAQALHAAAGPSQAGDSSLGSDQMDVDTSRVREPSTDAERVPITPSGRTARFKLHQPIPIRAPITSNDL